MWLFRLRNRHFFVLDLVILCILPVVALALRDVAGLFGGPYLRFFFWFIALGLLLKISIFSAFGLYKHFWRYASLDELLVIVRAVAVATALLTLIIWTLQFFPPLSESGLPRSVPLLDGLLTLVCVGGTRLSVRLAEHSNSQGRQRGQKKPALIVGAGNSGALIARELRTSPEAAMIPIGFVDDDPHKQGLWIHGLAVLGTRRHLAKLIEQHQVEEVIIAMPTAPGKIIREVIQQCEAVGVVSKTLPGISELLSGQVSVRRLRNVEIEDLLRREPVQVDLAGIAAMLAGKRVLVTGAGGSIGSELCRQILRCDPAQLIMLGHGENSLFLLSNELRRALVKPNPRPQPDLLTVVADVRDRHRLQAVFTELRPQIVLHAAAHKHVPMMEANIADAVTNNVMGTQNVVELSAAFGVERFVLISSDKAVNPVSVMGATKRVAERIVADVAERFQRPYVAVRFGNVLGSRGSVVPFFRQQIADGGPVTVTHPEMKRYFMTIPEAVQLVLQAAALSHSGEIFVLDMGQPVRIAELAADLIKLSGYQVGRDIDIIYSGLRPGEKLFEELFLHSEDYTRTDHSHIFAVRKGQTSTAQPAETLFADIQSLIEAAQVGQTDQVRQWLKYVVPEYTPTSSAAAGSTVSEPEAARPTALFSSARPLTTWAAPAANPSSLNEA